MAKQNPQKGKRPPQKTQRRKSTVREQAAATRSKKAPRKTFKEKKWEFSLSKENFIFAGIALAVILLGYGLMATGITEDAAVPDGKWNNPLAVTVAPILLIIGYCVLIPYAIMRGFGKKESQDS